MRSAATTPVRPGYPIGGCRCQGGGSVAHQPLPSAPPTVSSHSKTVERDCAYGVGDVDGVEIAARSIPLHQRVHQAEQQPGSDRWVDVRSNVSVCLGLSDQSGHDPIELAAPGHGQTFDRGVAAHAQQECDVRQALDEDLDAARTSCSSRSIAGASMRRTSAATSNKPSRARSSASGSSSSLLATW